MVIFSFSMTVVLISSSLLMHTYDKAKNTEAPSVHNNNLYVALFSVMLLP